MQQVTEHREEGVSTHSSPNRQSLCSEKTIAHEEELPTTKINSVTPSYPQGVRAWSVVLGVFLLQFTTFGYTNSHGVFTDYYVRDYLSNYSSSAIGWIGSTQLMLTLSCGLLAGRAYDAGHFYPLVYGGSFLLIFSMFMLSITQSQHYYQVFLCHGLGIGLANGIVYVPSMGVISQHFRRSRVIALGVASAGSGLGGLIHPIMLNKLIRGPLGFHTAIRVSASVNAGLVLVSLALMRTRFTAPASSTKDSLLRQFRSFLKEPAYICTVAGTFFVLIGIYFPVFFIQLNNIENGINPTLAFYTLSILNGCNTLGRIIPNLFAQRFGVFNAVIICTAVCALMVFILLAVKTVASTILFCIIFGFFSGAYTGLLAPTVGSLAAIDSEIGSRLGVCFMFTGMAGLIGTPIAGSLLTSEYRWVRPILFAGFCEATGSILFLIARSLLVKQKATQWL